MDKLSADTRYSHLKWNSPLSESSADILIHHLQLNQQTSIVDIGCGWGELLLRAVDRTKARATGVDTDEALLARGRAAAGMRGIVDVDFVNVQGREWDTVQDRAICVGSSHAYGGTRQMLESLARVVPEGRVLIGDMCWEKAPPSTACAEMFGEEVLPLRDVVALCRETGWKLMHLATATQQDWDAFESGHRAGPREWLLQNPHDPSAEQVEKDLAEREEGYFGVYRGQLGFVYAILAR